MVFKGRFFSSTKSDSSSPERSNSPKSLILGSFPFRSDKKKAKSAKDDLYQHQQQQQEKGRAAVASASASPIAASSLGLNRIKTTRSGPLPQDRFSGFEDIGAGCNFPRKKEGEKNPRDRVHQENNESRSGCVENGSDYNDWMERESVEWRDQSPNVKMGTDNMSMLLIQCSC